MRPDLSAGLAPSGDPIELSSATLQSRRAPHLSRSRDATRVTNRILSRKDDQWRGKKL
jgi:hypothetical protein